MNSQGLLVVLVALALRVPETNQPKAIMGNNDATDFRFLLLQILVDGAKHQLAANPHEAAKIAEGINSFLNQLNITPSNIKE